MHDLRTEVGTGCEMRHYRLRNYIHRNAENYPTHELGPIAKILGINSGNRMLTLTSMASKAVGMHAYAAERNPENKALVNTRFAQGDVVNTMIKLSLIHICFQSQPSPFFNRAQNQRRPLFYSGGVGY